MNTQAEPASSVADIVKQVFSVVLVVAGVAAFYYFSTDSSYFKEVRLLYRVLGLVAIVAVAIGMFLTTDLGHTDLELYCWSPVKKSEKWCGRPVKKQCALHCWYLQWSLSWL